MSDNWTVPAIVGVQGADGADACTFETDRKWRTTLATIGTDGIYISSTHVYISHGGDETELRFLQAGSIIWFSDSSGTYRYKTTAAAGFNIGGGYVSFAINKLGDTPSITAGTTVGVCLSSARGPRGISACAYSVSKTYRGGSVTDTLAGYLKTGFLVHYNGSQVKIGVTKDSAEDTALKAIPVGSHVWLETSSGRYQFIAKITAKLRSGHIVGDSTAASHTFTTTSLVKMAYGIYASKGDAVTICFTTAGASGGSPPANTVPGAPKSPTTSSITQSQIKLAWSAPNNNGGSAITGYRIDRSTSANSGFATIVNSQSGTSYTNTGLTANTRYYYRVYAINSVGTSTSYASVNATTLTTNGPGQPASLTLSSSSDGNTLTATWTPPSTWGTAPASTRKYEHRTSISSLVGAWIEVDDSVKTYSQTTLIVPGNTYTFEVRAKTSAGTGPVISKSITMNNPGSLPSAPKSLSVTTLATSYTATWSAPDSWGNASPSTRKYEYRHNSTGSWTELDDSVRTFTKTGLTSGTTYSFQVRAKTSNGTSAAVSVTIKPNTTLTYNDTYYTAKAYDDGRLGEPGITDPEWDVDDDNGAHVYLGPAWLWSLSGIQARTQARFDVDSGLWSSGWITMTSVTSTTVGGNAAIKIVLASALSNIPTGGNGKGDVYFK